MRTVRFQTNTSSRVDGAVNTCHPFSVNQKKNIVIIGASDYTKVVIDTVRQEGKFNIAGLLDQSRETGELIRGCPVLGSEEDLPKLVVSHDLEGVIMAVGNNYVRSKVVDLIRKITPELPFFSVVHPRASIAEGVSVGEGTVVMEGASVGPSCSIGQFCILNTNSSLDNNSVLEDFVTLAPRATTGGNCRVGEYSKLCSGATLIQGINIGKQTLIGAGSVVVSHLKSSLVAYGTPAKVIRARNSGDGRLLITRNRSFGMPNFLSPPHYRQNIAVNPSPLNKTQQICPPIQLGVHRLATRHVRG